MGDHQDCHGILCIVQILYPEVPNRGPGIGVYSHRMDACTNFFFKFSSRTFFFLRLKACSNFFWGFLQPPPQISNGPSLKKCWSKQCMHSSFVIVVKRGCVGERKNSILDLYCVYKPKTSLIVLLSCQTSFLRFFPLNIN